MLSIRVLRSIKHISQRELARRAGLSAATLNRIERGVKRPAPDELERLAAALAVTPADLAQGPVPPSDPAARERRLAQTQGARHCARVTRQADKVFLGEGGGQP